MSIQSSSSTCTCPPPSCGDARVDSVQLDDGLRILRKSRVWRSHPVSHQSPHFLANVPHLQQPAHIRCRDELFAELVPDMRCAHLPPRQSEWRPMWSFGRVFGFLKIFLAYLDYLEFFWIILIIWIIWFFGLFGFLDYAKCWKYLEYCDCLRYLGHAHTHTHAHTLTRSHAHTRTRSRTHVHTRAHTRTHAHTRAHARARIF